MATTDVFWGERFARVRDPFGHQWGISALLREMTPDEIRAAASELVGGTNDGYTQSPTIAPDQYNERFAAVQAEPRHRRIRAYA